MAKYREQYRRAQTTRVDLLPAESFLEEDLLQALARFFYQA